MSSTGFRRSWRPLCTDLQRSARFQHSSLRTTPAVRAAIETIRGNQKDSVAPAPVLVSGDGKGTAPNCMTPTTPPVQRLQPFFSALVLVCAVFFPLALEKRGWQNLSRAVSASLSIFISGRGRAHFFSSSFFGVSAVITV